ncbi:MAG: hypothetical protein AAF713_11165 [Pseudomonadota bacterium]
MESDEEHKIVRAILEQDNCFSETGIDFQRWAKTIYFPLLLMSERRTFTINDGDELTEHLRALETAALQQGIARLQTRIQSLSTMGPKVAIVRTIRDRLGANEEIIDSTSMTWTLIHTANSWRINQIYFNDSRYDPSVVFQVFS